MLRAKLPLARNILLHFRFIQQFLMHNTSWHVSLPSLCFLHFSNVMADLAFLDFANNNTLFDVSNLGQKTRLRLLNSVNLIIFMYTSLEGKFLAMDGCLGWSSSVLPQNMNILRVSCVKTNFCRWPAQPCALRRLSHPCHVNNKPSTFLLSNENTLFLDFEQYFFEIYGHQKMEFHLPPSCTKHTHHMEQLWPRRFRSHIRYHQHEIHLQKHNWKRTPLNNYKLLFAQNGAPRCKRPIAHAPHPTISHPHCIFAHCSPFPEPSPFSCLNITSAKW